jgi:hypothetical protein
VRTSLDETMGWMQAGGETTCKTDVKQMMKQMMKRPVKRVEEK